MSVSPNNCNFILKSGSECGAMCLEEKCIKHLKRRPFAVCSAKDCDKFTNSKYGFCSCCGMSARENARRERRQNIRLDREMILLESMKQNEVVERENRLASLYKLRIDLNDKLRDCDFEINHEVQRISHANRTHKILPNIYPNLSPPSSPHVEENKDDEPDPSLQE